MTVEVGATPAEPAARRSAGALAQAARDVAARLELAWNRNSGEGVAALFGERADYIPHNGGLISGRDAIRKVFDSAFAGSWSRSRSEFRLLKVKPLAGNLVVAMLGQRLTLLDGEASRERMIRSTAILRGAGGDWRIVLLQGTAVAAAKAVDEAGDSAPETVNRT